MDTTDRWQDWLHRAKERAESMAQLAPLAEYRPRRKRATATESRAAVDSLFTTLAEIESAIQVAFKKGLVVRDIFDRTGDIAAQASAFAGSGQNLNATTASQTVSTVINQINPMPLTPKAAVRNWIKAAPDDHTKTVRTGIVLSLLGVLIEDVDKSYNPVDESRTEMRQKLYS